MVVSVPQGTTPAMKEKYIILGSTTITLILVILLSLFYFNNDQGERHLVGQAIKHSDNIITVQATKRAEEISYQSNIEPISKSQLISPISGHLSEHGKKYGSIVQQNEPIVNISSQEAKDELLSKLVQYISSKDNYKLQQRNKAKNIALEKKGIVSKKQVEEAESAYMKSLISVIQDRVRFKELAESLQFDWKKIDNLSLANQTESQQAETEKLIEKLLNKDYIISIKSQQPGMFLPNLNSKNEADIISTTKGSHIKKNQQIGIIADPKKISITVQIPEYDISKFHIEQPVEIKIPALHDTTLLGQITDIKRFAFTSQSGEPPKIPIIVTASCKTKCYDYYGLSVVATVLNDPAQHILIPIDAVKKEGNEAYVIKINDNTPIKTVVQVGQTYEENISILAGLQAGDRIVSHYPNQSNQ